jgi:hypothetical protein
MTDFTIVTEDGAATVTATRAGTSVRIATDELRRATGWKLEPEGLCRGDVCVPVRDRSALVDHGQVDLRALADAVRAPLALDDDLDIAVLGASAGDRATEREGMHVAPDLVLRDLDGNLHHWSELGRKKKLLAAWASW